MVEDGMDLYRVLGVARAASADEVAAAYRRQLRRLHPDTRTDDALDGTGRGEARGEASGEASRERVRALQEVLAAYAVLGDPARRARYDQDRPARRPRPAPPLAMPGSVRTDAVWLGWQHDPNGPGDPPLRAGPVRYHRGGAQEKRR